MMWTSYCNNLILLACYSGVLVALLATLTPQLPFQDFDGLIQRPNWDLAVRTNTAQADVLSVGIQFSNARSL